MQLTTKKLLMLVLLTQLLSSCYSSKKLNRKDEPITSDFLSRIEPGKRYEFRLYTGEKQTIYVTSVEDRTITGYVAKRAKGKTTKSKYSASFKSVMDSVDKISIQKFSPILTTAIIAVPTTLVVIIMSETWTNVSTRW